MLKGIIYKTRNYLRRKALVLMYHRIGELAYDPFELAVSPANFEEQLATLRQKWNPISLPDLARGVKNEFIVDRSVVITFDDGYIDNFNAAIPLLECYHIPATFYITTNSVEKREPFWWDELQSILLESPVLPAVFRLQIGQQQVTISLEGESTLTPQLDSLHRNWAVEKSAPPTRRSQTQLDLWRLIRPLVPEEQQIVLNQLRVLAGLPPGSSIAWQGMAPDQIRQISENPLFTVGAHTHTHPALADHEPERQKMEINRSKRCLETVIGQPVTHFSYPFGSHNEATLAILERENLETSVTTNEGTVVGTSRPLQLNRYQVNDWNARTFHQKMTRWYNN